MNWSDNNQAYVNHLDSFKVINDISVMNEKFHNNFQTDQYIMSVLALFSGIKFKTKNRLMGGVQRINRMEENES